MKLKNGVIISKKDNGYVAVAVGSAGESFSGMLKLNDTSAFIVEKLKNETTVAEIADALCEDYEVSRKNAENAAEKVIVSLTKIGLIEK